MDKNSISVPSSLSLLSPLGRTKSLSRVIPPKPGSLPSILGLSPWPLCSNHTDLLALPERTLLPQNLHICGSLAYNSLPSDSQDLLPHFHQISVHHFLTEDFWDHFKVIAPYTAFFFLVVLISTDWLNLPSLTILSRSIQWQEALFDVYSFPINESPAPKYLIHSRHSDYCWTNVLNIITFIMPFRKSRQLSSPPLPLSASDMALFLVNQVNDSHSTLPLPPVNSDKLPLPFSLVKRERRLKCID